MTIKLEEMARRVEEVLIKYGADLEDIMTHPDGLEMMSDFMWAVGVELKFVITEREEDD